MPGKVNPTQCESVTMVAAAVMGNDVTIGFAASQGQLELNVFMPVTAHLFLESARLLTDSMNCFRERCVEGIVPVEAKMAENVNRSLMLATALSPLIGYDKAAQVAKKAHREGLTLKESCEKLGYLEADQFDRAVCPEKMV